MFEGDVLDRGQEALACYNAALARDPAYTFCWFDKALLEESLKEMPGAVQSYRNFLKFAPNDAAKKITHPVTRVKELTGQH